MWSQSIDSFNDLRRFIRFWAGPRQAGYGLYRYELARFPLPQPLYDLLNYAGRWPGVLNVQDYLLRPQDMRLEPARRGPASDEQLLVFLKENQGVWYSATLPTGEDPPVWWTSDIRSCRWELAANSLTQYLIAYVLQELVFACHWAVCSEQVPVGTSLLQRCLRESEAVHVLARNLPYEDGRDPHSFYLCNGNILGAVLREGAEFCATSDPKGRAFLDALGITDLLGNRVTCYRQRWES